MSQKVKKLESLLGNPLNTHNFIVVIPALNDIQILVSATSFPAEQLRAYELYFQGERVKFPSLPTNSGEWNATLPEGEYARVYKAVRSLLAKNYNQQTGVMTHWALRDKFNIEIYSRGLRGDVDGSDKVFGVRLMGCFLRGMQDVSLSNQAATTAWEWQLSFSFDWIESIKETPLGPTIV